MCTLRYKKIDCEIFFFTINKIDLKKHVISGEHGLKRFALLW